MIKIAICDDQEIFCQEIERKVSEIFDKFGVEIDVDVYFSGKRFLKVLSESDDVAYDLIFLDVHLDGISGISIGNEIKKPQYQFINKIVYISSDLSKVYDSFSAEPFGFIPKPIDKTALESTIGRFLKRHSCFKEIFSYKFKKITYRLLVKDIVFFESNDKKILIHKLNGEIDVFYDTLDRVEAYLSNSKFLRINKSYLVNTYYVSEIKYDNMTVINGEILKVSRNIREKVSKQLSEYILKGW